MAGSLFERLGGAPALDAAVDIFYRKVLQDPALAPYFESVDMDAQRAKQKNFLSMVFGGPATYSGKDLRTAHKPLVDRGLTDRHFDAVAGHLRGTLQDLGVAAPLIDEVIGIATSTRKDVLNR